jgi:hypothetical protein
MVTVGSPEALVALGRARRQLTDPARTSAGSAAVRSIRWIRFAAACCSRRFPIALLRPHAILFLRKIASLHQSYQAYVLLLCHSFTALCCSLSHVVHHFLGTTVHGMPHVDAWLHFVREIVKVARAVKSIPPISIKRTYLHK